MKSKDTDLAPRDGLCDYFAEFAGLDRHIDSADADVRFRFTQKTARSERIVAEFGFPVRASNDGLAGQVARGHDALILFLRQTLYIADKGRRLYRKDSPE